MRILSKKSEGCKKPIVVDNNLILNWAESISYVGNLNLRGR